MKQQFADAASSYSEVAVLARETGERMAERLDYVKIAPQRVADIGCATGDGIRELQRRYPSAQPLAIDFALPMLAEVLQQSHTAAPHLLNADVRALPLAANSLDLIWSNLMLHWLDEPLPALRELYRTLNVGGLLMFSILGPDTLKELRSAFAEAGVKAPLRSFYGMRNIGDMLVACGFSDPVMDRETLTLTYTAPRGLLRDQRHLGVRDALLGQLGWRDWRRVFRAYSAHSVDNRLSAAFEIIYGHAWKLPPRKTGDAFIRFER